MLLLVCLIAVSLAWYVDRTSRNNIAGTWGFPDGVEYLVGTAVNYSDVLTISNDGKFTKTQTFVSPFKDTYRGDWSIDENGLTVFNVKSVSNNSKPPVNVDYSFLCRCTVDSSGFLIVNEHISFREMQDVDEITYVFFARLNYLPQFLSFSSLCSTLEALFTHLCWICKSNIDWTFSDTWFIFFLIDINRC